jgi:hypothetical protein
MNIFTVNQVNQVYVLKSNSTVVELDASTDVTKTNNLGTIGVGKTPDNKSLYFKHLGAGGITRSDLIEIKNILDIKATPASKMARNLTAVKVTINSEALSSSAPITGQDYILKLAFQNPVGMSSDNQYWKYGVVHATASMTASNFYLKLASSIAKNMAREATQLIRVFVTYSTSSETEITAASDISDTTTFSNTYTGIIIKEVEQDWILGIKQQKPLIFTVEPGTINNGTEDVVWGDVIYSTGKKVTGGVDPQTSIDASNAPAAAGTIVNSKLIADFEYFFMGERGDQYRLKGWPDYIPTTYLVDPTNQYGYDTIGIHFAYVGANHAVQKSEKDITILVPRAATDTTADKVGALADSIVDAIEAIVNPSTTTTTTDDSNDSTGGG